MSNDAPAGLRVESVPYGIEFTGDEPQSGRRAHILAQIDAVNRYARQWQEQNQGQAFETETVGGCVLVKREVLQKIGLFPTRTPLGTFDAGALGARVRQAGFRLLGWREVFIHSFGSRGGRQQ